MSIPDEAMARFREIAGGLGLPPEETDEAIYALFRIMENRFDAKYGEDSVQISMWEKAESAGRTQREHASLPSMISHSAENEAADQSGGKG